MGYIERASHIDIETSTPSYNNTDKRSKGFHAVWNKYMGRTKGYHYDPKASEKAKALFYKNLTGQ